MHPSKDLAVSPLCCHRIIPLACASGCLAFRLGRHCSHLCLTAEGNCPLLFILRSFTRSRKGVRTFLPASHKATQGGCFACLGFPSNVIILTIKIQFSQYLTNRLFYFNYEQCGRRNTRLASLIDYEYGQRVSTLLHLTIIYIFNQASPEFFQIFVFDAEAAGFRVAAEGD